MKNINIVSFVREIESRLSARYDDKTLCNQYAWWMLESVTNKKKPELIALQDFDFTQKQLDTLDLWVKKQVVEKEPLQYLLGSVPFCDLEILVEPPVLIPRPETEQMCYYAISILQKMLQKLDNKNLTILDIGTGTGCIALTLAKALPESLVYAIDISDQALTLAAKNAKHNKISNVKFLNSNVYAGIQKEIDTHQETGIPKNTSSGNMNSGNINSGNIKFDLIISNPPYITQEEFENLDESVAKWEDKQALVANKEGLAIIEEIITKAHKFLKTSELKVNGETSDSKINIGIKTQKIPQLIIEIGYKQGLSVSKLFKLAKFVDIVVKKDLEGKDRFVMGRGK